MQTAAEIKCLVCGAVMEAGASRFCSNCRGGSQGRPAATPAFPMEVPAGPRRRGSRPRRALAGLIGAVAALGVGTVVLESLDPDRYLQGATWEQDEIDHFRGDVQDGARNAGAEIPDDILDCVVGEVMKQHTPDQMRVMATKEAEQLGATLTLGCIDSLGYGSSLPSA